MKKKTVIAIEKHEVWVIRQPGETPPTKDQDSEIRADTNESDGAARDADHENSLRQPEFEEQ